MAPHTLTVVAGETMRVVWLTLATSVGSCLSYMFKTRRFLLHEAR